MITSTYKDEKLSCLLFYIEKGKCLIIIIWLCFQFASANYAQDSSKKPTAVFSPDTNKNTHVSQNSSTVVNIIPAAYQGGKTEWIRYLVHNLVLPEEMRGTKFTRNIVVKFTVDTKGRLKNFEDAGNDVLKKESFRN